MKYKDLTQLREKVYDKYHEPYEIFTDTNSNPLGFENLQDAIKSYNKNTGWYHGKIDNSDCLFAKSEIGWIIIVIELNCTSILNEFNQFGITSIMSKSEADALITGSSLDKIKKILYSAFPMGTFTEISNDVKTNADFFDLSSAYIDAKKNQQLTNFNTLYFIKTHKSKWLYFHSIKEERAKDVKYILELNRYEVISYKEAKSNLIDNGYILRNE